jgi:hypothetical protein
MLHVGFSFYFALWNATRHEGRGNSNFAMRRERDEASNNGEWVVFLVSLAALKVGAVLLVRSILNHARAISLTLGPSGASVASSLVVEFAAIPLAVTAVDHLADINAAYKGGIHGPWASLCQSTLQTYFFVRPLLTLAGHNINPQDGRMGIALCFLGIAVWLSLPSISRRSSRCDNLNHAANIRRRALQGPGPAFSLLDFVSSLRISSYILRDLRAIARAVSEHEAAFFCES